MTDLAVRATNGRDVASYNTEAGTLRAPTPFGGYLEIGPKQRVFTEEQMVILAPLGVEAGWDPRVVMTFLIECRERGLDPWQRETYLMLYAGKFIRHIGIDGFRKRGESTGEYKGRLGPFVCDADEKWREIWPHKDRPPVAAKVGILRAGFDGPVWATAMYDEYVPMQDETKWDPAKRQKAKTGRRVPTSNWRCAVDGGKPMVMLGKCAEAQAWRAAFPARFGGFYIPEEFERQRAEEAGAGGDDAATVKRKAAFAEAQTASQGDRERIVIDAEVVPDTADSGQPFGEAEKQQLLAELDEQAEVLGKTVTALCERWSASRGGRAIDTATAAELADHVHRIRPYVIDALREQKRDVEADRYEQAPPAGTCDELFGRGPVVVEPPTVEASAPAVEVVEK